MRSRVLLAAIGLLLIATPAAHAADVSVSGSALTFVATDGEADAISVSFVPGTYTISDPGAGAVTPGAGCTTVTAHQVTCSSTGVTSLAIDARDLDDLIELTGVTVATTLTGGNGADTLRGGDGADTVNGGGDGDSLDGRGGNDTLNGDAGDDALLGGTLALGNDTLNGGTGTDTADYSARTAAIATSIDGVANDGTTGETDNVKIDVENVTAGSGNDTLTGYTTANVLSGGGGRDFLDGDSGNDTLDGGAGDDILTGGVGTDLVTYASRAAAVTLSIDGVANDGEAGIGELDDIRTDVESVTGGAGNDTLTGGALADTLSGGAGVDTISGGAGADTLNGDDGDDVLEGGAGGDIHNGGAGFDTADYRARIATVTADLDGAADDGETAEVDNVRPDVEQLLGGVGNDTLTGNNSTNVLDGGPGDDQLDPGKGQNDVMTGGDGVDTVTYATRTLPVTLDADGAADDGEAGDAGMIGTDVENITGGGGNDRLTGTAGVNLLNGGAGNDVLDGGLGADLLIGGSGADTADYSSRSASVVADPDGAADDGVAGELDTIETDVENLTGGSGDDELTGALGTNILAGGLGADVLDGAQGDDDLDGGDGSDDLTGGSGADLLRGGAGTDRLAGRDGGSDRIRCQAGTDTAILDAIDDVNGDCESVDVPATVGPSGPAGTNGTNGTNGAQGPAGTNGANGKTGAQGPGGPAGAQGPAGPQGAAGRDAVVTCKPVKGKGRASKFTVSCTVQLAGAGARVRAVLMRGGHVLARSTSTTRAGAAKLKLRHAGRGRYAVRLTIGSGAAKATVVRRLRIR